MKVSQLLPCLAALMALVCGRSGNYGASGSGSYRGTSAVDALNANYNNFDGYNNFDFGYDVQDPHYGNYQSRQESGSADPHGRVTGSYTVVEPDGSRRTVQYNADWINGFRATVSDKNGVTHHGYVTDEGSGYGGSRASGHGGAAADSNSY